MRKIICGKLGQRKSINLLVVHIAQTRNVEIDMRNDKEKAERNLCTPQIFMYLDYLFLLLIETNALP